MTDSNYSAAEKLVEQLETKKRDAAAALELARNNFREACLDAENAGAEIPPARRKNDAAKKLEAAEERLTEVEAALEAARGRAATAKAAADTAECERRWKLVDVHLAERAEAVAHCAASVEVLAQAFARVAAANRAIDAAAPVRLGHEGALTGAGEAAAQLRLEMVRAGMQWAAPWRAGTETLPAPFVARFAEADAYIGKIRRNGRPD